MFTTLSRESLDADPLQQFRLWYQDAEKNSGQNYPMACALSTITDDGYPEVRTVLMREYDSSGFTFYTNLNSRKGRSLQKLPRAGMVFHWDKLYRQVRIVGDTTVISDDKADHYFANRLRISQVGAWASNQSSPLKDRKELEQRFAEYDRQFTGKPVPRPPHWKGFTLLPKFYEFMQEGEGRLHDRFIYERSGSAWKITRLNP